MFFTSSLQYLAKHLYWPQSSASLMPMEMTNQAISEGHLSFKTDSTSIADLCPPPASAKMATR